VNEIYPLEDMILLRVRDSAPDVPEDVLSSTGPAAQLVFARATATTRSGMEGRDRARAASPDLRARSSIWLGRQRIGAFGLATVLAAVIAAMLFSLGGGPSIVQRAYAAIDPTGVIVHYVETTVSPEPADRQQVAYWLHGLDSRQVVNVDNSNPKYRQDIVTSGGLLRNLGLGKLVITPVGPTPTRCAQALVLLGDCAGVPGATPMNGLRSLYHSGRMHVAGHTTVNGRPVDVLVGSIHSGVIGELKVKALVDAHTFSPVRVTITDALPKGNAKTGIVNVLTITHYQRLPVTPRTLKLLALPAHPGVPVIRFHTCPTKKHSNELCR
jgi:hypothetical protein